MGRGENYHHGGDFGEPAPPQNNLGASPLNSLNLNNSCIVFMVSPAPIEEDATMMIETLINSLRWRSVLISRKVKQIAQIASLGVSRRGRSGSPMSFVGVLQGVLAI